MDEHSCTRECYVYVTQYPRGVSALTEENNLVALTIEVVASYVAHNNLRPDDVPGFIAQTHAAIAALTAAPAPEVATAPEAEPEHQPAVTVRKSLASREHILSMIDGKPYKTLKRHISRHGMTPAEYRERYGLKADYPMTAPAYSEHRREAAKSLGLGRKPAAQEQPAEVAAPAPVAAPQPAKRGRKPRVAAEQAVVPAPAKRRGRPPKAGAATAEVPAEEVRPEPMFD
jgi:predicted transcriptional regulator